MNNFESNQIQDKQKLSTDKIKTKQKAYLLTWNKDKWNGWPGGFRNLIQMLNKGESYCEEWSVSNSNIQEGDMIFLMKTGSDQGIIATGIASSGVHRFSHRINEKAEKGMTYPHIIAKFLAALDYERGEHIRLDLLRERFPKQNWTPQASGIEIRDQYLEDLCELWVQKHRESIVSKQFDLNDVNRGKKSALFLESLHLKDDITYAVHKDGRVHLKYRGGGFALLDFRKEYYLFSTREVFMRALGNYDYRLVDYQKRNNAVTKLSYDDNDLVLRLISYIQTKDVLNGPERRIKPILKKDIELSEQQEWGDQSALYSSSSIRNEINTEYSALHESRKEPQTDKKNGSLVYPRDSRRKISALKRAGFICEYDSTHVSFISRSTGKPYMEPHHLIPLEYWASFENDIDVEANIVCLCSNCHNEIHYGVESERIVKDLYEKRKNELCSAGLDISFEVLMKMYDGSYVSEE